MAIDFALIGHQESWTSATNVMMTLRDGTRAPLGEREVREIYEWIPARPVCHITVSSPQQRLVEGVYIDAFIPPDELGNEFLHRNFTKVKEAADCAIGMGAQIVSLGGFSSILVESNSKRFPQQSLTSFTTGNTLTVAFILSGVEQACARHHIDLQSANVLIIGATGDVGSGCARLLATRARGLLLQARNRDRLQSLAAELSTQPGLYLRIAGADESLVEQADVVICAASLPSTSLVLEGLPDHAVVCDAGYPKNLSAIDQSKAQIFYGGLGKVTGSIAFKPDLASTLNHHPISDVAHGCLLEGVVLALEGRNEPYSSGRGNISVAKVDEMFRLATRHGITTAPLFNGHGLL